MRDVQIRVSPEFKSFLDICKKSSKKKRRKDKSYRELTKQIPTKLKLEDILS